MSLVSQILMADWFSSRCALTWKLKGTKFNRLLFQLRPKTHRTEGIDAGLLPTPRAQEPGRTSEGYGASLTDVVKGYKKMGMLPTPQAMDSMTNPPRKITASGRIISNQGHNGSAPLKDLAMNGMLPTPRVFAYKDSATDRGKGNLGEVTGAGSQLNPRFVAEMMGFPPNWTELPFQSGETKALKVMEMP
jgi:hypothetical protein